MRDKSLTKRFQLGMLAGLRHAATICETRKVAFKHPAFNSGCDEVKIMIEAAIGRVEAGEDMNASAVVQED